MSSFTLTTPVAFFVFNRPETTARVFAAIREARPSQLLIVADGPRSNCPDDICACAEVRHIVEQVDWPCSVLQNFADGNFGCRKRVSSGLDWVFNSVEEAIILEDDCLPAQSFFQFSQELLEYCRDDHRIGMISGDNFQFDQVHDKNSYYFSKNFHIWGWATWRNRWIDSYDVDLLHWPENRDEDWLKKITDTGLEYAHWSALFEKVYQGKIDTWDYQWVYANWSQSRLCILPSVNLVSNIGFDSRATHTKKPSILSDLERRIMDFPLRHPSEVTRNIANDRNSAQMTSPEFSIRSLCNVFKWCLR